MTKLFSSWESKGFDSPVFLDKSSWVQVVDGPLKGGEGIMVGVIEKRKKLIISVDPLNRAVEVEIEGWLVEKI